MKVVHVTHSPTGGAGIAAMRLHQSLLSCGVDSNFLAHNVTDSSETKCFRCPSVNYNFVERLLIHAFAYRQTQKNSKILESHMPPELRGKYDYNFPWTDDCIEDSEVFDGADLINLHLVSGMINFPRFFNHVTQPIIWTLHDLNPVQAGFHYEPPHDLDEKMLSLESSIRNAKNQIYKKSTIRGVVGPSHWITQQSLSDGLLGELPHRAIANSVPTNLYKPQDKVTARERLGLPIEKTVLLFVSAAISDPRKGFDILLEALQNLSTESEISVAAIGSASGVEIAGIHHLGILTEDSQMAQAYAAADAFIIPSREDNLPNVVVEALCCGTPCIGTPVGGIPELIKDGVNGFLAKETTSRSLGEAIERFLVSDQLLASETISQQAIELYSGSRQASSYLAFYEEVMGNKYSMQDIDRDV